MRKRLFAIGSIVLLLVTIMGNPADAKDKGKSADSKTRNAGYEQLASKQPAHSMEYSPTRETINFWIDTWKEPGKLSYVYLLASNGQMVGYYVLQGLPVSMCAALTPNYDFIDMPNNGDGDNYNDTQVPAPGVDGVYYSGGQCNEYFGKDASTGAYIEYSAGSGINALVYSEPLPKQKAEPLGFTNLDQAAQIEAKQGK